MRRVNEAVLCKRKIVELNRLKQIKKRKYSWLGQLVVYSQPVEVTLYLTHFSYLSQQKFQPASF